MEILAECCRGLGVHARMVVGKPVLEYRVLRKCDKKEVRRLLDPRQPSKLPRIEAALVAVGQRLIVELQSAA